MKRKKLGKAILIVSLVAVLLVGGTWAYLNAKTNVKLNPFTFTEGLSALLLEPKWDGDTTGNDVNDLGTPTGQLGKTLAQNLVPDVNVPKNPQVKNTCDVAEYIGVRLTFQTKNTSGTTVTMTQAQYTLLMSLIDIQYGASAPFTSGYNPDWPMLGGTARTTPVHAVYYRFASAGVASPVLGGASTTAIFDNIYIKDSITGEQLEWLNGTADYNSVPKLNGGFQIFIEGAAVQASVFNPLIEGTTTSGGALQLRTDLYTMLTTP